MNSPSPSSAPTPSHRLRRWSARLTLLVAALASVATSQPTTDAVEAEHTGSSFTVTTGEPAAERNFIVRATTSERSSHTANLDMELTVTGRWTPADASNPGKPVVQVRVFQGDNELADNTTQLTGEPGQELTGSLYVGTDVCELQQDCEWRWRLEATLAFEGEPVEGILEVDWGVKASSYVEGTNDLPRNYTLRIEEP